MLQCTFPQLVLLYKESENDNIFFEKLIFKKLFTLDVIYFLFNTEETRTLNFSSVLHVNRVFQVCIRDTRLIAEICR